MKVIGGTGYAMGGVDADEWEHGPWTTSPFLVIRIPSRMGIYQKRLLKVDWKQGAEDALATAEAELAAAVTDSFLAQARERVDRLARSLEAAVADDRRDHPVHWLTGECTVDDLKAAAAGLSHDWRSKTDHPGPAIFRKGEELRGTIKLSELKFWQPGPQMLAPGRTYVWAANLGFTVRHYGEPGTNEFWSPNWQYYVPALPLISLLVCVGGVVAWGVTARRLCDERVQDCTPAVIT